MSLPSHEKICACPFCHNPWLWRKKNLLRCRHFLWNMKWAQGGSDTKLSAWENFILSNDSEENKDCMKQS